MDSVKQLSLLNVVGIIQSTEGSNRTKRQEKEEFDPSCLSWEIDLLLPHSFRFSGLWTRAELHHWLSWVSSLQLAYLSLRNCTSQFLIIYIYDWFPIYLSIYLLLILFL